MVHHDVQLVRLGIDLGFAVTVLDDREEFATGERFAPGVRVRRADFEQDPFAGVAIATSSYVALVTRGHRWDFDCLRRLLSLPVKPRYIGMIGSRRRVRVRECIALVEQRSIPRRRMPMRSWLPAMARTPRSRSREAHASESAL